jgi:hypothetical protein
MAFPHFPHYIFIFQANLFRFLEIYVNIHEDSKATLDEIEYAYF